MMVPTKNTFVHFNSESDSENEGEVSFRRCNSAPPVCCAHLENIRGSDTMLPLSELADLSVVDSSGHFEGTVCMKNTFIDFDRCHDPDFQLPPRRRCLSEPRPDKTSDEDSAITSLYGATLPARAARLLTNTTRQHLLESATAHSSAQSSQSSAALASASVGEYEHQYVGDNQAIDRPTVFFRAVRRLMLCNLPCKLSEEGLAHTIDILGFAGLYDDIHIPRGTKNGMGYGFVRFRTPEIAAHFVAVIGRHTFPNSQKRVYCKVATRQE